MVVKASWPDANLMKRFENRFDSKMNIQKSNKERSVAYVLSNYDCSVKQ